MSKVSYNKKADVFKVLVPFSIVIFMWDRQIVDAY